MSVLCKPEPGPRCSAHAKQKLDQHVAQRNKRAAKLRELMRRTGNSAPKPGEKYYSPYKRLRETLTNSDLRVAEALEVYRTTPDGLTQLWAAYTSAVLRGNMVEAGKACENLLKHWHIRYEQMKAWRVKHHSETSTNPDRVRKTGEDFTQQLYKYDPQPHAEARRKLAATTGNKDFLNVLASDPNPVVRAATASNPATPHNTLLKLAGDEGRAVQDSVLTHPSMRTEGGGERVVELLQRLSTSDHSPVRVAVAGHPHVPQQLLQQFMSDVNRNVRLEAGRRLHQ